MTQISKTENPLTKPLKSGEYARSVVLDEENPFGVPEGQYLIARNSGEVEYRAKLTLGPQLTTEVIARFPAEDGTRLLLLRIDSHIQGSVDLHRVEKVRRHRSLRRRGL